MINLLPPKEKEILALERKKKLVIVLAITFLVPLCSLILVLLSVRFYLLGEANSQKIILDSITQQQSLLSDASLIKTIENYNEKMLIADNFYKKQAFASNALKAIFSLQRPSGLRITTLHLEQNKSGGYKATISGVSDTRENLIVFKEGIEADKNVKNSYFPPESWVKSTDINFNAVFDIIPFSQENTAP